MPELTNNMARRLTVSGVEVEPGATVTLQPEQITPAVRLMAKGSAVTIEDEAAGPSGDETPSKEAIGEMEEDAVKALLDARKIEYDGRTGVKKLREIAIAALHPEA